MTNAEIVLVISMMAIGLILITSLLAFRECMDKGIEKSSEIVKFGIKLAFYVTVIAICIIGFVCN